MTPRAARAAPLTVHCRLRLVKPVSLGGFELEAPIGGGVDGERCLTFRPTVRRYVLRATSHPPQEAMLREAVITIDEGGVTLVSVGGEPLFVFASLDECLSAYAISRDDLEDMTEP